MTGTRKILITAAISAIFAFLYISSAKAESGAITEWVHGNYTYSTDTCGTCHSTHNATGRYLTKVTPNMTTNDIYQNCTYCHSPLGSSKYDEVNGINKGNGADSNPGCTAGGGFENMPIAIKDFSADKGLEYTYTTVSSIHMVNQPNNTQVNIPGGTLQDSPTMELTCASCHDVHGNTENSMLLRVRTNTWDEQKNEFKAVDTPKIVMDTTSSAFNNAITDFCIACHTDYLSSQEQYHHPVAQDGSTAPKVPATSASGINLDLLALPLSSSGEVTCLTCHNAHGTMAHASASTYTPIDSVSPSVLLRMDERGVCQNCHNKTPDKIQPYIDNGGSFETSDLKHVVLTFSNHINKKTAENPANYTVSVADVTIASIEKAELLPNAFLSKQVLLTLDHPIDPGTDFIITVQNLLDLNGNAISASGNRYIHQGQ